MKSLEVLNQDHRLIERILERTGRALETMNGLELSTALEFFAEYVDGVHHSREEGALFPALAERAESMVQGPISVMMREHEIGRSYMKAARGSLEEALGGSPRAKNRLEAGIRGYIELLRGHIHKEDHVLYPMAERILGPEMDERLLHFFAEIDQERRDVLDDPRWSQLANGRLYEPTVVVRARKPKPAPVAGNLDARTLALDDVEGDEDQGVISGKAGATLFERGGHLNLWLHDFGHGLAVQANQFLIIHDGQGMILDPGGPKVYPAVFAETMLHLTPKSLRYIFLSHQDPDIGTSLNAWLMDTQADAHTSRLWVRFLPHFGIDRLLEERLKPIPDEGTVLPLGGAELVILPAHFLHSPGNFQVYDPTSKILFTGDLGASLGAEQRFVTDFDAHAKLMAGFHKRYMASRSAMAGWSEMVRDLDIEVIAPQHGAVMRGKPMVARFIDWCANLECGVDLGSDRYRVPLR